MIRNIHFLAALLIAVMVFFVACVKEKAENADKQKSSVHGQQKAEKTGDGLVYAIRNAKLANYQSATIGSAFDGYKYMTNKEWKSSTTKGRPITVDFTGWFDEITVNGGAVKDGVTARGLNVKFVIEPNGSYYVFMVIKFEAKADGKIYGSQLTDIRGILDKIYANKKISF